MSGVHEGIDAVAETTTGYTASISARPELRRMRQAAGQMSQSTTVDRLLAAGSVVYGVFGFLFMATVVLIVLPLFFLRLRRRRSKNISTDKGGSLTAVKTLNARAVTAACGFGPDALAVDLIRRHSLVGDMLAGWLVTQLYWRSLVLGFRLTRRLYVEQLIPLVYGDKFKISEISYLQLRTCWLDDVVERFVEDLSGRPGQLVVLGAGYDTRCLRLELPATVRRFEVDASGTQERKRALLRELQTDDAGVTYVTCDFEKEGWLETLAEHGFSSEVPTCFVWEGVTMYLTRDAVEATLRDVASCAPGSVIGFDYFDRDWVFSPLIQKATRRGGEPWEFGLQPDEPGDFVEEQGLVVLERLGHDELLDRYMPRHASGRSMGYCGDFGGFVLAVVPPG